MCALVRAHTLVQTVVEEGPQFQRDENKKKKKKEGSKASRGDSSSEEVGKDGNLPSVRRRLWQNEKWKMR